MLIITTICWSRYKPKGKGDLPPEDAIQSESNRQWPINITGQDAPGYIVNVTIYRSSLTDAKSFHASLKIMSTESMCKYIFVWFCLFFFFLVW